jgi:hypothetical protein
MHALKKLPVASEQTVFRGAKVTPAELHFELDAATGLPEVGLEFTWSAFSSTACTQGVMAEFVGTEGSRTLLTLQLTEPVARNEKMSFGFIPQGERKHSIEMLNAVYTPLFVSSKNYFCVCLSSE